MTDWFRRGLIYHATEPKYPLVHYNFKTPDIDFIQDVDTITGTITQRILAQVLDMADTEIVNAICKTAASEGVTDLFLIDKDFIMSAIRNEMARRKAIEDDKNAPRCGNCTHHDDCICVICEENDTVVCMRQSKHVPKGGICQYWKREEHVKND